ncbi:MAG: protein-L-isoaspartate(D-aspartate) O-methyltransferase [Rhodospirillales bacterium]
MENLLNVLHQQMVEIIAAHAFYAREHIGKETIDPRVLDVMGRISRHDFVPLELTPYAYADQPLPIGYEKTISQPFMIALMTDLLQIRDGDRVLEIGTGLGYHTAILAALTGSGTVYTVEIIEELAEQAHKRLATYQYRNIVTRIGNGESGWVAHAPFDRIVVCAGVEMIPTTLLMQLAPGGRMVIPTGMPDQQTLMLVEKGANGRLATRDILPVRFAMLETAS